MVAAATTEGNREKEISERSTLYQITDHDVGEDLLVCPVPRQAQGEDDTPTSYQHQVGHCEDDDHQL